MPKISQFRKSAYKITEPIISTLEKTHITPTALTWIGFAITVVAAVLIANGYLLISGFVVVISGFFDMLDGSLARRTNRVTHFGSVLDSTLDRVSEAILLGAILLYYLFLGEPSTLGIMITALAMIASPLVSYVRSRAETIGLDCKIGLFTRSERVVTLSIGLWFSHFSYVLIVALGVIAVFSFITAGQRLHYVSRNAKQ